MDNVFTDKELGIARDIVTLGLEEAARSLGKLIKSETHLELNDDFYISKEFSPEFLSKKNGTIYLLYTELLNDLTGASYLLFSEEEVKSIMSSRYENKDFDDAKYKRKSESLILEIDNIITAAVMSQFANSFNYRTYGGVPNLDILEFDKAIEIIKNESNKNEIIIRFNAKFISDCCNLATDFIWFVDDAFISGVKKIAKA